MDKLDKASSLPMDSTETSTVLMEPTDHLEVAASTDVTATTLATTITSIKQPTPRHHQPKKSVEGWIVFATGIPAEAESDDIERVFSEYGNIHSIHLNVDRRTGYLKGYALVEYCDFKSAQNAILNLNDSQILEQRIKVDWCFLDVKPDHHRRET